MVSNLAAKETGRWGGQLRAQAFGLTGLGDQTYVSIYSTSDFKEQQILQAGHSFRPGNEGLTVNGQFTYAWTQAVDPLERWRGQTSRSETLFATLGAAYPLIRTQAKNLSLGAGFDFVNQKTDLLIPIARDRLRVLGRAPISTRSTCARAGPSGTSRHAGASSRHRRVRCQQDLPCKANVPMDRRRRAGSTPTRPRSWSGSTARPSSASSIRLLSRSCRAPNMRSTNCCRSSSSRLGNYTVGRGYEPSILTGDSGVGVAVELRGPRLSAVPAHAAVRFSLMPSAMPPGHGPGGSSKTSQAPLARSPAPQVRRSGVRGEFGDRAAIDMSLAVPIDEAGLLDERRKRRCPFPADAYHPSVALELIDDA